MKGWGSEKFLKSVTYYLNGRLRSKYYICVIMHHMKRLILNGKVTTSHISMHFQNVFGVNSILVQSISISSSKMHSNDETHS